MIQQSVTRNCHSCGKGLKGRSDKKFCNDYCRNHYNNGLKAPSGSYIRTVNRALNRNRKILQTLLGDKDSCTLPREALLELGFVFQYNTQVTRKKWGSRFYFCYEYGYCTRKHEVQIIRKEKISMLPGGRNGYLNSKP